MIILGLNAYHGDSSACIVIDGKLIAAAAEERFRRIKHWSGFPSMAIKYVLKEANVKIEDVDYIAVNRNPRAHLFRKVLFALRNGMQTRFIFDRLKNASKIGNIKKTLAEELKVDEGKIKAKIIRVEHHIAHIASASLVSPFEKAAVVSVDGFGDFVSAMWAIGENNDINVLGRVFYPHSLGLFYLAFTQFLGFPKYGDEYKMMGLAAYGKPTELKKLEKVLKLNSDGTFELNLDYFLHHKGEVTMTWENGEPTLSPVFSKAMEEEFGKPRKNNEPITSYHENLAASVQAMYEEAFFNLLNSVYQKTKLPYLCLAGGCALNSVANGKIFSRTPFKEVYIQPAAGDDGGAIGAAYYVWNVIKGNPRKFVMEHAYWGPDFSNEEIENLINARREDLKDFYIERIEDEITLCKKTAEKISQGKVVGWFQGRMEWGPRALGNRSILCDPRRADMKDILNVIVKKREPFRPFAPSILLERVGEYFEIDYPEPFMIKVYPVREEKRHLLPAVTHVDGTGRLQTVSKETNPLYWQLIKEFENLTGVPVVLNTSFNENEPIVCTPEEALECFLRTKMDVLVLGKYFIERTKQS